MPKAQISERKYQKSLYLFRRDLRVDDNTALLAALEQSDLVIPCFIFDPRQVAVHPYRSISALQFMIQSLVELDEQLKTRGARLYLFQGEAEQVVGQIIEQQQVDAVFVNHDYTPFSKQRDAKIEMLAIKASVDFNSFFDLLLTEVGEVMTGNGTPYTIYSHFAKKAAQFPVPRPKKNSYRNYLTEKLKLETPQALSEVLPAADYNDQIFIAGGRKEGLKILKRISDYAQYDELRNLPAKEATTGLSAHNKFGTVSIREVYHAIADSLGASHTLIRELYWRDFFSHVAHHFPDVFGLAFHRKYQNINWENDRKKFKAWCRGSTGFPIVDAGMRQLNATGFMHNRVRMIVASFLVKDLHIDWQWGEKYFAQKLVDYDPAVNNGNWQWAASTGCDAQPYFRIFNPWIQGKKFDPQCEYIKKWLPELRDYSAKEIQRLEKGGSLAGYPAAIVNHAEVKQIAEDMFIEAAAMVGD